MSLLLLCHDIQIKKRKNKTATRAHDDTAVQNKRRVYTNNYHLFLPLSRLLDGESGNLYRVSARVVIPSILDAVYN